MLVNAFLSQDINSWCFENFLFFYISYVRTLLLHYNDLLFVGKNIINIFIIIILHTYWCIYKYIRVLWFFFKFYNIPLKCVRETNSILIRTLFKIIYLVWMGIIIFCQKKIILICPFKSFYVEITKIVDKHGLVFKKSRQEK